MARFNGNDFENYSSNTGGKFFSLKDDKDVAQVRFLYNGIEDITGIAVHQVEVGGNKRYVSCLRLYNEPVENCPLCQENFKITAKLYIPLLVYPQNGKPEIQLWERGKAMYSRLSSLAARYQPLSGTVFEIERNGRKGDQKTTYEIYPIETGSERVEDLVDPSEIPDPLGTIILDKNYDELVDFLNTGNFPQEGNNQQYRPRGQQPQQYNEPVHQQDSQIPQRGQVNRGQQHQQRGQQSRFAGRRNNPGDVF